MLAEELGVDVLEVCQGVYGLDGDVIVDEFNMLCPNPKHADTSPSCNVNLETGYWQCWSCGAKGDIITLGQVVLRKGFLKIKALLAPGNLDARRALLQSRLRTLSKPLAAPLTARGDVRTWEARPWLSEDHREPHSYRSGPMDYLYDRGFEDQTIERWGCRFVRTTRVATRSGTAEITNSIGIPLLDEQGRVIAWSYRASDNSLSWQPKYLDTLDAPMAEVWHGIHLVGKGTAEVVVCEGPLDAMRLDQTGVGPVLSAMGSRMPSSKVERLSDFRKITLMFDRDTAGVLATEKIGEILWRRAAVYVARYPKFSEGTDPAELSPVDIELALANRIPWTSWTMRAMLASRRRA